MKPDENFNTLIILPFKKKNTDHCFEAVSKGLKNLNEYSLLFLRKISCIEMFISGDLSHSLERQTTMANSAYRKITITKTFSGKAPGKELLNFIIFSRNPGTEKQQPELAFRFDETDGNNVVLPIHDAPVFVYFPTKVCSG